MSEHHEVSNEGGYARMYVRRLSRTLRYCGSVAGKLLGPLALYVGMVAVTALILGPPFAVGWYVTEHIVQLQSGTLEAGGVFIGAAIVAGLFWLPALWTAVDALGERDSDE